MKIGILGAGMMTEALAGQWVRAGHEVLIGGRSPEKARDLAKRLGARAGTLREAAEFGEVVLLAVLRQGLETTLRDAGAGEGTLAGKAVIDCGNAVETTDFSLITYDGRSMAQEVQRLAPGSRVVKAFNMAHAKVWQMEPPVFGGRPFVVPMAGDEDGKRAAGQLVRDMGAEPLDVGDLGQAGHLEAAAIIVIKMLFSGYDPHTVFAFLTPGKSTEAFPSR